MTQREGAQPATGAIGARRRPRAGRDRKRPTASPKQPGFLKLRARGNDAARRRATRNGSRRTSQRRGAWIVRMVGVVRTEAEVAEVAEVAKAAEAGWTEAALVGAWSLNLIVV
jgi:hypothetical protein